MAIQTSRRTWHTLRTGHRTRRTTITRSGRRTRRTTTTRNRLRSTRPAIGRTNWRARWTATARSGRRTRTARGDRVDRLGVGVDGLGRVGNRHRIAAQAGPGRHRARPRAGRAGRH